MKTRCKTCKGEGTILSRDFTRRNVWRAKDCFACHGTGKLKGKKK